MVPDRVHAMRLHGVPIADIRSTLVPIAVSARSLVVAWTLAANLPEMPKDARTWFGQFSRHRHPESRCRVIRGDRRAAHPRRSCDGSVSSACRCIWTDRPFQGADSPVGAPWAFMGGLHRADRLPGRRCTYMRGADGRSVASSTSSGHPHEHGSGTPLPVACRFRHIRSASVC
jgi:hypothetical protein